MLYEFPFKLNELNARTSLLIGIMKNNMLILCSFINYIDIYRVVLKRVLIIDQKIPVLGKVES